MKPSRSSSQKISYEAQEHRRTCSMRSINRQKTMSDKLIKVLDLDIKGRFDIAKRVYSPKGISPTLNSGIGHGGGLSPKFIIIKRL